MLIKLTRILLFGQLCTSLAFAASENDPLPGGWVEHLTGGDTLCARGSEYSFFVNPGASDRLIVDFIGGGACWNNATCDVGSNTFTDSVDALRDRAREGLQGVYDKTNADNPYAEWTHVVIPYCTGDIHWGSRDKVYTRNDGSTFEIHHRGAVNTETVLNWVEQNLPKPEQVLVNGCSAGSYGSIYWTPHLKKRLPDAKIAQFGDSGAGVLTKSFLRDSFPNWNAESYAPSWIPGLDPAEVDWSTLDLNHFYEKIADHHQDIRFAQFNNSGDRIQKLFLMRMGGNPFLWSMKMKNSMIHLASTTDQFHYFIDRGSEHCATIDNTFYDKGVGGTKLHDWLNDHIHGRDIGNIR